MQTKTLLLLIISSFIYVNSFSQIQWGVKAGGNMSAMLMKDESGYLKTKLVPGFHFGGLAEIPLSGRIFVQPSLLFTSKGFKVDQDGFAEYLYGVDQIKFTSYHVELPINFIFKPQVGKGNMLLGAGPYVAYGLGGNWKAESNGVSVKGKLKFLNDYISSDSTLGGGTRKIPYTKPFDFGGNILIGYEINENLFFHINGQIGLIDIDPSYNGMRDEKSFVKTVGGGLSVGYRF